MRDLILTAVVFGSLLLILRRPYIGILVWSWLSYMNPHRLAWGFAYNMPFAQIVAITLITSLLFNKDRKGVPVNATTVVWAIFLIWMTITTIFALKTAGANYYYFRILKIQLITFLTIMLITEQKHVNQLVWVIILSIGFFSIKGGVFTILSGGGHKVWGPASSFIEDNNALALATLMIIPLMFYLYKITENRWIKYFLLFSIVSSFASALGSQSRGALLAVLAVAGFFWLKSPSKLITGPIVVLCAVIGFSFMPDSWHQRMSTIQEYEQDRSAMGRINAWYYSVNIANARITGGGLNSWSTSTFAQYAPDPLAVHAAHSIYFGVLGDHGWPGLVMFLLILFLTWRTFSKIIKQTDGDDKFYQANLLSRMIQVSLIAYFVGGAFLSLSYFDLPWHLIALALIQKRILDESHPKASSSIDIPSTNSSLSGNSDGKHPENLHGSIHRDG